MRIFSARVRSGAIVPNEEVELAEGARVTVVADDDDADFELSSEDEKRLLKAMDDADRGDVISAEELFRRLGG